MLVIFVAVETAHRSGS